MVNNNDNIVVKFTHTGDWWADFGLVNLHDEIEDRSEMLDDFDIEFSELSEKSPNSFSLSGPSENIKKFLIQLKDEVVAEHYANYKSGKKNYYLDNKTLEPILYDKTSVSLHLKKFFGGILSTPERRTSFAKLSQLQQKNLTDFITEHKSELDPVDIKRVEAKDDKLFVGEMTFDINWNPDVEEGTKVCCLSGEKFAKLEDAKGYHYPSIVTAEKMQTFYSGHKGKLKIGAPYVLACLMAPLRLRYVLIDSKGTDFEYVYFVPIANTLYRLAKVQRTWLPPQINDTQSNYCNFERSKIYTSYLHESLLVYLLSSYYHRIKDLGLIGEHMESEPLPEDIVFKSHKDAKGISVMAFTDSSSEEYRGVGDIFALFSKMLKLSSKKGIPIDISAFLRGMIVSPNVKNAKIKTYPREKLSKCILGFKPIGAVLEDYLFNDGKGKCFEFFRTYSEASGIMTEEQLDLCESMGIIIGRAAANRKSIGVIYDFRNSKTKAQFLNALEMFHFVLGSNQKDPSCFNSETLRNFMHEFNSSPDWQEMKSAVVIKAVNLYQASSYAAKKGEGK